MQKNIILATGMPGLNKIFTKEPFSRFVVKETITRREEVLAAVDRNQHDVDVILVTDALPGNIIMTQLLVDLRMDYRDVRIVYLTADVNKHDERRMNSLGMLARVGIYDIVTSSKMNPKLVYHSLIDRKDKDAVDWIFRYINKTETQSAPQETIQLAADEGNKQHDETKHGMENVFLFSSIKPGTGKSFVASNVATMIAKYGKRREDGQPPRVALIDSDLQNLSLGTLLQIENEKYNLKTVMDKIRLVLDDRGREIDNPALVHDVQAFIKSSFLPYSRANNLEALVGSQLTMDQIEDIKSSEFIYLLESIKDQYDVIIVDSNSSLAHVSTVPLLVMATTSYYILNLDFNNIRNNSRYQKILDDMGVLSRVKYILNENLTNEQVKERGGDEQLIFTEEHVRENGFELAGSIPLIDKPVFLNRIYEGSPVALSDELYTLEARVEIARLANQIWEVEKLPYMEDQLKREEERKNDGKKRGFFGRNK